jgi:hypothetical protein
MDPLLYGAIAESITLLRALSGSPEYLYQKSSGYRPHIVPKCVVRNSLLNIR